MGGPIPRPIKVEVIRKWLEGKSRDQISKEVGIGAGTISGIINEVRQRDPEFDLLREVAVKLKNKGYSIESFAPLVRCREILRRLLLDTLTATAVGEGGGAAEGETKEGEAEQKVEEKIETLMVALEVFCYKQNIPIKEFVNDVHYLSSVAERLGIPLEDLRGYVKELESNVDRLSVEVEEINLKKQDALEDYDLTLEVLDEYTADRPLFETNQKLREQLDKVTKERDTYRRELEDERIGKMLEKELDSINNGISEEELEEANMKISYPARGVGGSSTYMMQGLTPDNLKEMLMKVYFNPSKYIDIIKQLMK
jgi:hypothetical protein